MVRKGLATAVCVVAAVVLDSVAPGLAVPWWQPWLPSYPLRVKMACSGIRFVSRYEWGARPAKNHSRLEVQPVRKFFVHHTEGPECFNYLSCSERMRHWQNFHMDARGWDDLGYSFLIGGDGRVYVSRSWDRSGAHTKGHNQDSLAAAFIGDFSRHLPTPWAMAALARLLQCGVALGKIRADYTIHGHRDAACRTCPGDALYSYISRWRRFGGRVEKYVCELKGEKPSNIDRRKQAASTTLTHASLRRKYFGLDVSPRGISKYTLNNVYQATSE